MSDFFYFEIKGEGIFFGEGPFKRSKTPVPFSLYAPDFYLEDPEPFIVPSRYKLVDNFPAGDFEFRFDDLDEQGYRDRFNFYSRLLDDEIIEKAVPCAVSYGEVVSGEFPRLFKSGHRYFLKEGEKVFFGSSPEIFLSYKDGYFLSEAVAGTLAYEGEFNDSLIKEHEIVLRDIIDRLGGKGSPAEIINQNGLFHRRAKITGKAKMPLLEVVKHLHPTAAVGVFPRAPSLRDELVERLCPKRGRFGAPIGIFRGEGDVHLVVAIRGIELNGCAILRAGSGIIKGRRYEDELSEIKQKMLRVIGD